MPLIDQCEEDGARHFKARPEPERAATCKLTECQGKPRCAHCTAMDKRYGLHSPEKALRALIAECEFANEQCVQRFKHTVIDLKLLDEVRAALGERTATSCGGWPTLRSPAWQPPEKLTFEDDKPPNVK